MDGSIADTTERNGPKAAAVAETKTKIPHRPWLLMVFHYGNTSNLTHGCWSFKRSIHSFSTYETPPIWPYLLGETKRLPVEAPNAALGVSHAISSKVGYRSPSSSMSHGISWGQRPSNDSTCSIYQIFNKTVRTSGMRCQPKLTTCWHLIMIWS